VGMSLRRLAFLGAMFASPIMAQPAIMPAPTSVTLSAPAERRRRRFSAPDMAPRYRRSRNAPTRRRLRANRLHMSRRVRRRHRRAG
jgi:hypothetical protein